MEGKMVLTRTKKVAECHLLTTWAMFLNICCLCVYQPPTCLHSILYQERLINMNAPEEQMN